MFTRLVTNIPCILDNIIAWSFLRSRYRGRMSSWKASLCHFWNHRWETYHYDIHHSICWLFQRSFMQFTWLIRRVLRKSLYNTTLGSWALCLLSLITILHFMRLTIVISVKKLQYSFKALETDEELLEKLKSQQQQQSTPEPPKSESSKHRVLRYVDKIITILFTNV